MPDFVAYRTTEEEFLDAELAEAEKRATPLIDCYLCDGSPLRGIIGTYTSQQRFDPTQVLILTCGHHII